MQCQEHWDRQHATSGSKFGLMCLLFHLTTQFQHTNVGPRLLWSQYKPWISKKYIYYYHISVNIMSISHVASLLSLEMFTSCHLVWSHVHRFMNHAKSCDTSSHYDLLIWHYYRSSISILKAWLPIMHPTKWCKGSPISHNENTCHLALWNYFLSDRSNRCEGRDLSMKRGRRRIWKINWNVGCECGGEHQVMFLQSCFFLV